MYVTPRVNKTKCDGLVHARQGYC